MLIDFLASFEGWQSLSFHRGAPHQNFNAGLEPTHRLAAAARSATAQKAPEIFNKPGPAHLLPPRCPLQLLSLSTPVDPKETAPPKSSRLPRAFLSPVDANNHLLLYRHHSHHAKKTRLKPSPLNPPLLATRCNSNYGPLIFFFSYHCHPPPKETSNNGASQEDR